MDLLLYRLHIQLKLKNIYYEIKVLFFVFRIVVISFM